MKIKTLILCSVKFFRKSCRLWDHMEIYDRVIQAADDNILLHMRIACWIAKAADTHSEYIILLFYWNNG